MPCRSRAIAMAAGVLPTPPKVATGTILEPPSKGSYQLFFYANGLLCFYHVNRGDGPYRFYQDDEDGFSRLYACAWTTAQDRVDLSRAVVLRLPVVGETTFAWGQLRDQIVCFFV